MKNWIYFISIFFYHPFVSAQVANPNIIAIQATEPNSPADDLTQIKPFWADKKIIAFGEATHGTKEFFQLKHRFFKYLADSLHYKIVFMEAMYNASPIINDYILNGVGNQSDVLKAIGFDVYRTKEVWQLIEWLKEFNTGKGKEDKIQFYGVDMQLILSGGLNLRQFVHKIEPDRIGEFDALAKPFYNDSLTKIYMRSGKKGINPETKILVNTHLKALEEWFSKAKDKYSQATSPQEFALTYHQVTTIKQVFDFYSKFTEGYKGISSLRDSLMADNLKFVLQTYPSSTKAMLWAHNQHVTKKEIYTTKPLGFYLKKHFKNEFHTVGFVFHEGEFRALRGPKNLVSGFFKLIFMPKKVYSSKFETIKVYPLKDKNSLSQVLEKWKNPIMYFDFNQNLINQSGFDWLNKSLSFYELGASYTFLNTNKLKIAAAFDGLVYVKKTTAAEPIDE